MFLCASVFGSEHSGSPRWQKDTEFQIQVHPCQIARSLFFCWRQPCVFSHQDSSDGTALQDYGLCSSLMMALAPGASHCHGPTSGTVLARIPPQKAFSPAREILLISSISKDKAKHLWSRRRPTIRPPSRAAAFPTAGDRRSPLLSYC